MDLYITTGISASGKSKFAKALVDKFDLVELNADNLRLEMYNDINDQTHNKEIFKKIDELLNKNLKTKSVILSNTNLNLNKIIDLANKHKNEKIYLEIMTDSNNLKLCKLRLKNDLKNGVIRSKVPDFILNKQFEKFKKFMLELETKELPKNITIHYVNSNFEQREGKQ